jgi:hypothetical protein
MNTYIAERRPLFREKEGVIPNWQIVLPLPGRFHAMLR